MPTISRTFDVAVPPAAALEYLEDFAHAQEWDPGTQRCVRNDDGPIGVGSSWFNESKIYGVSTSLEYTLQERTDERLVFVGVNKSATSTDRITVTPNGEGSRITYVAEIELSGLTRLMDPVMKVVFERIGDEVVRDMTAALERLTPSR
ncbi:carbon monoxide dehydrogenase subunit G [Mumia flava]|uniref:Carbon monoxide dehydrogenase subunit G n=1 Tax=Mumia flava TaxID=1348852 RepID=A0A2M9AQ64_9ACTN|nr:SRPBCC family protein [Mumia flava]PJJ47847.1 carbon monoxide dehydrogenase subunit G [Mumia flava]